MIQYYDWPDELLSINAVDSIGRELAFFKYSELNNKSRILRNILKYPHKFDFFVMMVVTSGSISGRINLADAHIQASSLVYAVPGQIVEIDNISDDFDAQVSIMSHKFIEGLLVYVTGHIPFKMRWRDRNIKPITDEELKVHDEFFNIIRHILRRTDDNPYRIKVVEHVLMAFFYGSPAIADTITDDDPRSSADILSKSFLGLVRENFKQERQLKFYSDKLCITPRYLSRVVKECSGSSAAEWIERYVVLEARALLKSTNMTIQQVSDELNFPSQTFFGKYFKRRVGMSPKEYRRMG